MEKKLHQKTKYEYRHLWYKKKLGKIISALKCNIKYMASEMESKHHKY